ncbi:MAG: DUF5639 domain-containing protein [Deinococcus sp.]
MAMLEVSASDQVLRASADIPLLEVYAGLPSGLYPPFPPLELPGGLGGLVTRGGFGQNFFFAAEVLGLTFIAPSGRRVLAGGSTVKNVQGYDLTRPFVGSFGRLGEPEQITLRLRPGLAGVYHSRPGTLEQVSGLRARSLWQDGETLHACHFGHACEVDSVMAAFCGEPFEGVLDYRDRFPGGMGVGEGEVRDLRFGWADGGAVPAVPPLFERVARAL